MLGWALNLGFAGSGSVATASIVLTGSVIAGLTEAQVITGGETIIFTVSDDTWESTLGADNAITTAFIAGITSDQSDSGGWNAIIRDAALTFSAVTRDSSTVCTIILPAAIYTPENNETITFTSDDTVLTSSSIDAVATPTFSITVSIPAGIRRTNIVEPRNRTHVIEPRNRINLVN